MVVRRSPARIVRTLFESLPWLHASADCQPVLARHADAECGGKAIVKRHEVGAQSRQPIRLEAVRQHAGRTIAGGKGLPGGFAVGLAIKRSGLLEPQLKRLAKQFADPFAASPLER